MKDSNEKRENTDKKKDKDKSIFNIDKKENIYPSDIQSLFERLGLE